MSEAIIVAVIGAIGSIIGALIGAAGTIIAQIIASQGDRKPNIVYQLRKIPFKRILVAMAIAATVGLVLGVWLSMGVFLNRDEIVTKPVIPTEPFDPGKGYKSTAEVMEKLGCGSQYTNEQRELFLSDLEGYRTYVPGGISSISPKSKEIKLHSLHFEFDGLFSEQTPSEKDIELPNYLFEPSLILADINDFKKIKKTGEYVFDCKIVAGCVVTGLFSLDESKGLAFDNCVVKEQIK